MILNEQQQKVVDHPEGPLLVLACPGSGKTRCITERIIMLINDNIPDRNILAVTFTNKAANEMLERVKERGYNNKILICTFHSLCVRILRQCCHLIGYKRNFSICDDSKRLIRKITKSQGIDPKNEYDPERLIRILESKKNKLLSQEEFEIGLKQEYINIFRSYEKTLKVSNSFDFGDLIYHTVKLFDEYPQIQMAYAVKYKHILVDEMQDTNIAQLELIKRLASKHNNVIAVGDSDQVLYQWRGACADNILKFENHFENTDVIYLNNNYRSTSEILDVSEKLINKNKNRKMISLKSIRGSGKEVKLLEFANTEEESEEISNLIYSHHYNDISYKDMAILCRINSLTRTFEECFRRNSIPYVLIGSFGFYDRKEVKTGIAYMKFLSNYEDILAFEEAISTPSRGIGPVTLLKIIEYAINKNVDFFEVCKDPNSVKGITKKVKKALKEFSIAIEKYDNNKPIESLSEIFEETEFLPTLRHTDKKNNEHREENVLELLRAFEMYCKRETNPNLSKYLQEIMLLTSSDKDSNDDAVKLMTIHAAKGLEFDTVFIPGMNEDILPHKRSVADGNISEERRVCYVACTRAKNNLYLTRSGVKIDKGKLIGTIPSRFLDDMGLIQIDWN